MHVLVTASQLGLRPSLAACPEEAEGSGSLARSAPATGLEALPVGSGGSNCKPLARVCVQGGACGPWVAVGRAQTAPSRHSEPQSRSRGGQLACPGCSLGIAVLAAGLSLSSVSCVAPMRLVWFWVCPWWGQPG